MTQFSAAQARKMPVLGICYGMQLINALCGGTIYADVQAQRGDSHAHSSKRGSDSHPIQAVAGTTLADLIGAAPVTVNSSHLQTIAEIGAGLRINACGDDGVIEGIESADGRLLGLQCHPERMMEADPWPGVFAAFVGWCV